MLIGVPKEIKEDEYRVGLTPRSVASLSSQGHKVFIEYDLGAKIGFSNQQYIDSGAIISDTPEDLYQSSELIVKVKEPQISELPYLNDKHILFTFLHLAGNPDLACMLRDTGVTGLAYETLVASDGSLPLLAPMSEIAGKISIVVGNYHLLKPYNGKGVLLSRINDLDLRTITVIGAGVAGRNAIDASINLGAKVNVIDLDEEKLKTLKQKYPMNLEGYLSNDSNITKCISESDLIIGSVYLTGKKAPTIITRSMLEQIKPGTVLVDISIDQGGCFETSKPTTHQDPTFLIDDILHYCVSNMPGAVPLTASESLNSASLSYVQKLANNDLNLLLNEQDFKSGLNIMAGEFRHPSLIDII